MTTAVSNLVRYPIVEKKKKKKGKRPNRTRPRCRSRCATCDTHETVLVSRCYELRRQPPRPRSRRRKAAAPTAPSTPVGTALFAPAPPYGECSTSPPPGASISADGSTVAWMGEDIGQQAAHAGEKKPGLRTTPSRCGGASRPARKRPPSASRAARTRQTRRASRAARALCQRTPSPSDPCQGPFVVEEQGHRSRDLVNEAGRTDRRLRAAAERRRPYGGVRLPGAARHARRKLRHAAKAASRATSTSSNMRPGLTRDQALTPLTELAGGEGAGVADTAPIFDFDISPDGAPGRVHHACAPASRSARPRSSARRLANRG